MKKILGFILLIVGLYLCFSFFTELFEQLDNTEEALQKANELINNETAIPVTRSEFSPKENDVLGILEIPKLKKNLPIVEGTDEEMLAKGVGHYSSTVHPGDGEQILLSGHRDTVFRQFGELEIGDRFLVEMPYGKYEYEIRETEIVDANDTSIITPKGEEVLTLSTCYPFSYIGYAPDRYIIYAYPVS